MGCCWKVTPCSYATSSENGPADGSTFSRKRLKLLALLGPNTLAPLNSGALSR